MNTILFLKVLLSILFDRIATLLVQRWLSLVLPYVHSEQGNCSTFQLCGGGGRSQQCS